MMRRYRTAVTLICSLSTSMFSSCVNHTALRSDHVGFDKSYANSSNEQLLLNLARLANDDPVHFMQLGSISSGYTFSTGAGFSPSFTKNTPEFYSSSTTMGGPNPTGASSSSVGAFLKNVLTLGGSANASASENPIFQFIPLIGTNLVEAVMAPLNDKVFYTFYDQGYPANLVARTMVESVRHAVPTTNENSVTTNYEYWVNDPLDHSYAKFLEFCSDLRNAQIGHTLVVDDRPAEKRTDETVFCSTNAKLSDVIAAIQANLKVVCIDTNSGRLIVTTSKSTKEFVANTEEPRNKTTPLGFRSIGPLSFLVSTNYTGDSQTPTEAQCGALTFANQYTNNYTLKMRTFEAALFTVAKQEVYFRRFAITGSSTFTASDTVNLSALTVRLNRSSDPVSKELWNKLRPIEQSNIRALKPSMEMICNAVNRLITNGTQLYEPSNNPDVTLRPRTILLLQESPAGPYLERLNRLLIEDAYPELTRDESEFTEAPPYTNVVFRCDINGPYAIVERETKSCPIPSFFKVRPLMTLTRNVGELPPAHKLAEVAYAGKKYFVGDPERVSQNGTVFTILSYLFAQTAVSTQNLPVQQTIRLQ